MPGSAKAFTLVELLMIVAIIALLVSILLPALNRARAAAQGATFLTNVRWLAQAGQAYLLENSDSFPPFRFKSYPDGAVYVNKYGREKPPAGSGSSTKVSAR